MLSTKAVKAIIRDHEGRILVLQRNPKTRPTDNCDLPGGLMESGESEEETLLREVNEKLGVKATILSKGKEWHFPRLDGGKRVNVQNYECSVASDSIILSDEHIQYR